MKNHYDVIVIGAGLVGAAVSFDLAEAGARVLVLEAENDIAAGASRSNSGILHTGFDSTPDELETDLILAQGRRWREVFGRLAIPYRVPGALLLARTHEEESALQGMFENAAANGVATQLLGKAETTRQEPNAPAQAALLVPGEAITDPYEVVRGLLSAGQEVRRGFRAERVEECAGSLAVSGNGQQSEAPFVINCAGLFADELSDGELAVTPRRGEFLVYPPEAAGLIGHALLPVPNKYTKGVLVFPTLYGHVCVGPTAADQEDKADWSPRKEALVALRTKAEEIVPGLRAFEPVDAWAGLRTVGNPRNYYIEFSARHPNLLHVAGIRSTGLSACLGISQYVVELLRERGLQLGKAGETRPNEIVTPTSHTNQGEAWRQIPWWERLNELRGYKFGGTDAPRD